MLIHAAAFIAAKNTHNVPSLFVYLFQNLFQTTFENFIFPD